METQIKEMKEIGFTSIVLTGVVVLVSLVLHDKTISIGIALGCMMGLIGYNMTMQLEVQRKQRADQSLYFRYIVRLIFYICIFTLCVMMGAHPIALIVGFLCHKIAVIIYTYMKCMKH